MLLIGLVGFVALFELAAPSPSNAANGVHFDPDSPAGKEYALPLDEARNEATGNAGPEGTERTGSRVETGESAPLFGEGVSGSGPTAGQAGVDQSTGRAAGDRAQGPTPMDLAGNGQADIADLQTLDSGDGYSAMTGAALVAAILILGAAFGVGLRGLRRTRST